MTLKNLIETELRHYLEDYEGGDYIVTDSVLTDIPNMVEHIMKGMNKQDFNEESRKTLLEVISMLEKYENQDSQRIQEFNHSVFWLMQILNKGFAETIQEYLKEVKSVCD